MPTTGRFQRFCTQRCSDRHYRVTHRVERAAQEAAARRRNPEAHRAANRKYLESSRDEINARKRAKAVADPNLYKRRWERHLEVQGRDVVLTEMRRASLKRRYRITPEQYDAMAVEQNNCCAICGKSATENVRRLAVDHDRHCCPTRIACGECNRGLLCTLCNQQLGVIENDTWVASALRYLDRYGTKHRDG